MTSHWGPRAWPDEWEELYVHNGADGLTWFGELAYYPGKPSRPNVIQSHADFLASGVPDGFESIPDELLAALRESVRQAMAG